MRRGVLLDRDGVLNRAFLREGKPHPPATIAEVEILPGVAEAVEELRSLGLVLVGVSNQPDVARGTQTEGGIEAINRFLLDRLPLAEILVCVHDDADGCDCRKPRPGLLLRAAERHRLDLKRSFMVGDRWSDVEAGRAAGCLTFLVAGPGGDADRCRPDFVVSDLRDAAGHITSRVRQEGPDR
jgi:D-glycero-D-manno-heptose 1,7-bisphosphate phosphatase